MTATLDPGAAQAPAIVEEDMTGWRRADALPLWRRLGAFAFLASAYFCYAWSWNTVDLLRPFIARDLGLSLTQAGSMYSAQAAGALIGAVINGQLADRFGRRNALVVVMTAFGLLLFASAYVSTYPTLMLQRLALGYFTGTMYPITVGIYVTLFAPHIRGRLAGILLGIYNAAVALLSAAGALVFDHDWRLLVYVGLVPTLLAPFALIAMPDDRRLVPHSAAQRPAAVTKLPILELFTPAVRRRTLLLVAMCGLNFFAYQAFTGWVTTYLRDVRHLGGTAIGTIVSLQFWGSCIGGFAWGWIADRLGRRIGAIGFIVAAAIILAYLRAPDSISLLAVSGFAYGAAISSSVIWGPWLTELYPQHLRSTAASIFNWGRIISFTAPFITARVAEHFGLTVGMTLASLCFLVAAFVWSRLPETLHLSRG